MATKKKPAPAPTEFKPTFGVIADAHCGNFSAWGGVTEADGLNTRGRLTVETLRRAKVTACKDGLELFIAGDLFQSRRPEPAIVAAVQRVLDREPGEYNPAVIVPGNHDMLDASAEGGNTACEPLWGVANIVRGPTWFGTVFMVPFDSRVPMAQHLTEVLVREVEKLNNATLHGKLPPRSLVTHVGVWDDAEAKESKWLRRAKDGMNCNLLFDAMEAAGIRLAFVGNYHNHRVWTRGEMQIVQVGTLCPASFSDEGLIDRGLMVVSDGVTWQKVEIPGPRFVVDSGSGVAQRAAEHADDELSSYFVRQVGGLELDSDGATRLGGYEYQPAKVEPRRLPGDEPIATAPRSPEEALSAYVQGMRLADGGLADGGTMRPEVAALVAKCWRDGA
jgi:hypothetical protein